MVNRDVAAAVHLFKKGVSYDGKYIKDENDEEHFICEVMVGMVGLMLGKWAP